MADARAWHFQARSMTDANSIGSDADGTIRRIGDSELPGFADQSGVDCPKSSGGVLEPPVSAEQSKAAQPDGDIFHWYEHIRLAGWDLEKDARIVKLLYQLDQLYSEIKVMDFSQPMPKAVLALIGGTLSTLCLLGVFPPALATPPAQAAIGTAIGGAVVLGHMLWAYFAHSDNKKAAEAAQVNAIAAAGTSNGLTNPVTAADIKK